MAFKQTFTKWVKWEDRGELSGLAAPGVYVIAKSPKKMEGQPFVWQKEIIYIGVSSSLKNRLRQFDETISQKRTSHGGADRVLGKHTNYKKLVRNLYVSVMAVGTKAAGDTPACWRRIGRAHKAEYYCIAEYLDIHDELPEFNQQNKKKFSRSSKKTA